MDLIIRKILWPGRFRSQALDNKLPDNPHAFLVGAERRPKTLGGMHVSLRKPCGIPKSAEGGDLDLKARIISDPIICKDSALGARLLWLISTPIGDPNIPDIREGGLPRVSGEGMLS